MGQVGHICGAGGNLWPAPMAPAALALLTPARNLVCVPASAPTRAPCPAANMVRRTGELDLERIWLNYRHRPARLRHSSSGATRAPEASKVARGVTRTVRSVASGPTISAPRRPLAGERFRYSVACLAGRSLAAALFWSWREIVWRAAYASGAGTPTYDTITLDLAMLGANLCHLRDYGPTGCAPARPIITAPAELRGELWPARI